MTPTTKKRVCFVIPANFTALGFLSSGPALKVLERISHFVFYNVGTLQLASIARRAGHDVRLVIDDGRRGPDAFDADVVCISLTTAAAPRGYQIASWYPRRKVIIGGPHASALPGEAARRADHVVVGEGERVIVDLIEGRITEQIVHGGRLEALDAIPYLDLSLLPFKPRNFPIITSRGCPFACNFCAVTRMFGRKVRLRSPRSIVAEVKHYVDAWGRVPRLDLISPNFTIHRRHCRETLERLLAEGIRPELELRSSTDVIKDPRIPKLLARFPSVSVLVGAESFDEAQLAYYKKGRSKDDFPAFCEVMRAHGLHVVASFIWGSKLDTPETLERLIEGIYAVRPTHFQIGLLTPFPGTELYGEVEDRIFVRDWSCFDIMHVTHYHPTMDPYTMQRTWLDAQKEIWSLRNMLGRRMEIFAPPINKLFYWVATRAGEREFRDYLPYLRALPYPPLAAPRRAPAHEQAPVHAS